MTLTRAGWTVCALMAVALPLAAQRPATQTRRLGLGPADSALVARILMAEDRRDTLDPALGQGAIHTSSRIRVLAIRARERSRDAGYARRDSLAGAALPGPRVWPEAAWKSRYRQLTDKRDDCLVIRSGLRDPVVPVRLRAAAVVRASCAGDTAVVGALRRWVDQMPADVRRRNRGQASWHLAAHGLVALARLEPASAASRLDRLVTHELWHLRQYAARAATVLRDTATLRRLAVDRDANVIEAAIEGLSPLTGHADDALYARALARDDAQAVRAAAIALKGTTDPAARAAANAAFTRFARRGNASERDARVALLEAAGRPVTDDTPPARTDSLDREAVALALGAERQLEVVMAPEHGGGRFVVRLRGDVAPIMAARILALAARGHYDGTSWHRVEHDFVIQGGSRGANEYVGDARYLIDELGTVPHARGTVGMSTRGHDTGDAQWFINLRDNPRLARDYTVFAEVAAGMDVVDLVLEGDRIARIRPITARGGRP